MAYNRVDDIFYCEFCGENSKENGLMKGGFDEDGNHLKPFFCIRYLSQELRLVKEAAYDDGHY
jgi:hypothetical protein